MEYRNIIVLFVCCFLSLSIWAQETAQCFPIRETGRNNLPYQSGEELVYILNYSWAFIKLDVGKAVVKTSRGLYNKKDCFKVNVTGMTLPFWDSFFKVREDFSSVFTAKGIIPQYFKRDTYEGGYEAHNTYNYIWGAPKPYIDADVFTTSSGRQHLEIPLDECTYDLPALFFYARNMDFDAVTPDVRYPMTFAIDDDVYNVYFILHGRKKLKVRGLGEIPVIQFTAKLLAGSVFSGEADMTIYVSDDECRIPVYFEAPLKTGKATGRLSGYSGLKNKFCGK